MQVVAAYYIRIGGGNIWEKFSRCTARRAPVLSDTRLYEAMPELLPTFHFPARMRARVCDKLRAIVIPLVY
ncbi:MAG: hypothetical protein Q7T29_06640 [Gallionella sp.]|nr:hypothetical protein [Gallionella sp.]